MKTLEGYKAIIVKSEADFNGVADVFKNRGLRPYGGSQTWPSISGTDLICFDKISWHWTSLKDYSPILTCDEFVSNTDWYI